MWKFKKEKYNELLNGRSIQWLSKQLGYSSVTLSLILNCHKTCKKAIAIAIVKTLCNDNEIDDYFFKIEEGE